jgi:hypothetical protein
MKGAMRGRDAQMALAAAGDLLRLRWRVKFGLLALALPWAPRLTMSVVHWRGQ